MDIIQMVKNLFWDDFLFLPIAEMSFAKIVIVAGGYFLLAFLFVKLCKIIIPFMKKFSISIISHFLAREKCKKTKCKYCGRNLLDCICQKNKGLNPKKRLKLYKRELKEQKNKERLENLAKKSKIVFSRKKDEVKETTIVEKVEATVVQPEVVEIEKQVRKNTSSLSELNKELIRKNLNRR